MIKKYVKGSKENPEGVIKALENLGGVNVYEKTGCVDAAVYFIDNDNHIDSAAIDTQFADVITECFEEIPPAEPTPKVITNLDMVRWYFDMLRKGHAVQFAYHCVDYIFTVPGSYKDDNEETDIKEVRIDFGEWIPIEDAGIV